MQAGCAYRVLIVCHAFWEGLSRLPYQLHRAGCEVYVFGPPGNYVSRSKFVKANINSSHTIDEAVNDLQAHLERLENAYDWVVIGDDPFLYSLEKRRDEAWVKAIFPSRMGDDGIDFMTSKASFIQRCQEEQLCVPAFEICRQREGLIQAGQLLGFPLVIKEAQGFAGLAVTIIDDVHGLEQFPFEYPVIAQRFIKGRLGSAAVFFCQGELLAWFSYYRARTWGDLGPSAAIEFCVFPGLQDMLEKLGRLSGFHGICGVDFIIEADSGQIVLLEQNFRPTLTLALGRYVGIDCAEVLKYQITSGERRSILPFKQDEACKSIVPLFPQDVFRAIDARDWRGLSIWLIRPLWWREMNWRESKLWMFNLRQIVKKLIMVIRC